MPLFESNSGNDNPFHFTPYRGGDRLRKPSSVGENHQLEKENQRLREENERLEGELREQNAARVHAFLAWERERLQRSLCETALLSTYNDFGEWFDTAAFPMTCVGSDGAINNANECQLQMLGYARHEYVGCLLGSFVTDQDVVEAITAACAGGELVWNREAAVRCRNGSVKTVLISTEPFRQGAVRGICCYLHDLTEVIETRLEQRKSEGLVRQLTEHISEVFWMSTVDKEEMLYVSPRYETVWRRSCASLLKEPMSFLEGIHEDDRERVREALSRQAREGGYCEEYRVIRPDGTLRWVRDRAFPVRDDQGEVYRIAGLAQDITDVKATENALEHRAVKQKALAELGHIALTDISLSKVFDAAAKRVAETLEVEHTEILQFDPGENHFQVVSGVGWNPGVVGEAVVTGGHGSQAGYTLLRQEPVIVQDLSSEERFRGSRLFLDHGVVSGVSVLIEGREHPFGVLGAHSSQHRRFTQDDVNFLQAVAHMIGAAIERHASEKGKQNLLVELAGQRRRLDDILSNIPAVVWELKIDPTTGRLQQEYASDYSSKVLGYGKEELTEHPGLWQERVHPEDREKVNARIREVLIGEDGRPIQFRWVARDDRIVWIDSTMQVICDDAGNAVGLRGAGIEITQRKIEEAKREEAEERFHDMLMNLPAVVWESEVDPETKRVSPVFVSDYIEPLLGFPKEDWFDTDLWIERIHPEDREAVKKRVEEVFANEEVGAEQFRWIARDGSTVFIESSKRVVRDRDGKPVGLRGVNLDVTDRKQAEAKRREAEERIQGIMANVPGVVWEMRIDPETGTLRVVFVSDYVETMSGGYTKEDFFESPQLWIERVHPDDREMVKRRTADLFRGKASGSNVARWVRRDGQVIWIETSQQLVRDEAGSVVGFRGVTLDVTDRKLAEAEREAAEGRFQAFMDNSPVVALMKDEEGRYIYGNSRFQVWCEELGLDWYGATDFEIFPQDLARRYVRHDREAMDQDRSTQVLETAYSKDGTPKYWSVLRFPVTDASGRRSLGTVALDVTEGRRLEKEILEISDREQQRLGRELHDGLCQHLLGVAFMGKTLVGRMKKMGVAEAYEVQKLTDFLYDALGLARGLMRGFHLINVEAAGGFPSALQEFANTTSKLFGKACEFHSQVAVEVKDADVATHLFRIAQEATHNAIKHGQPHQVRISLEQEQDVFLLRIENDGESLPDEARRAEGMGIRTMKYRADLIGADLQLKNRSEGGVLVTCRVPVGCGIDVA